MRGKNEKGFEMKALSILLCIGGLPVCVISIIMSWEGMATEDYLTSLPGGWYAGILMLAVGTLLHYIEKSRQTPKPDKKKVIDGNREDLGGVVNIDVQRGGLFSSDRTQITTTKGTYQVYGDVGSVKDNEIVSLRNGTLWLGVVTEKRSYRFT